VLSRLRYEFALKRLQKEERATDFYFKEEQERLLANKVGAADMQKSDEKQIFELSKIHDQIAGLQTNFLRNEAERYLLPIPVFDTSEDGAWEFSSICTHYQLKQAALVKLRSAIRKEKKERRESWQSWAALAIGLIGAMIGLVAALKK
jgi:hypothetical protein